jgi:hypothetical protein
VVFINIIKPRDLVHQQKEYATRNYELKSKPQMQMSMNNSQAIYSQKCMPTEKSMKLQYVNVFWQK